MISLQFGEITKTHLSGKWKVVSFLSSSRASDFFLEGLRELSFSPEGAYTAQIAGTKAATGNWQLELHPEVIANPVISFQNTKLKEADRAMITRYAYMPEKYNVKKNDEMILYFSNGSEYVLEKISH